MGSILKTDPAELSGANSVLVYSNAESNDQAIRDINEWAHNNGFVRVAERWLRLVDNAELGRCYKGICYRMTSEDLESELSRLEENRRRRERMPMTTDSTILHRD